MPENVVPPVDPDLDQTSGDHRSRMAELEYELLSSEANMKRLAHREVGQRYWIKWIAIGLGSLTVVFMGVLIAHALHQIFVSSYKLVVLSPAFLVVVVSAPVLSITTIVGAVFVGAFRKKSEDDEGVGVGVAERASEALDGLTRQYK